MSEGDTGTRPRAGTVVLVGRPNAGKSTLLNRLVGERVAAVSDKPQTTRNRIVGIVSDARGQMVLYDTPGVHKGEHRLNRRMVETATETLGAADVVCLMVDASVPFGGGDQHLLDLLEGVRAPRLLALNKVDRVKKPLLLPLMARYADTRLFDEIVPLSALDGDGVEILARELWARLPEGAPLYDADLVTTHPERFLAAERIREQVLHHTRDELPFATAVLIDSWEDDTEREITRILATILVEKEGQRAIVIGREGSLIKAISTAARIDLEEFLGRQVFLRATVKCEPKWRESRGIIDLLERESMAADFTDETEPEDVETTDDAGSFDEAGAMDETDTDGEAAADEDDEAGRS